MSLLRSARSTSVPRRDMRRDRWRAVLASPIVRRRSLLIVGIFALLAGSIMIQRWQSAEAVRRAEDARARAWLDHPEARATAAAPAALHAKGGGAPRLSADSPERVAAALATAEAEGRVVERAVLRREAGGRFTLTTGGQE
ncbi:MAG: hypothetical protein ACK4XK_05645 [Casimicrobiaceae bacterium]